MFGLSISRNQRRIGGLTLIELMIALAIISLLAGIALPSVKEMIQDQKISRGASMVQSIIQEGQARSISRGGGGGIAIERLGAASIYERCQSTRIRLVDAPPSYSGEPGVPNPILGVDASGIPSLWFHPASSQMRRSADDINSGATPTLIDEGSVIQFSGFGKPLTINSIVLGTATAIADDNLTTTEITGDETQWIRATLIPDEVNTDLSGFIGKRVAYSITRAPRNAIVTPLELPNGVVIDLTASGMGRYGNDFSPMQIHGNYMDDQQAPFGVGPFDYLSTFILFGSRGEVSRVLSGFWNGTSVVLNDIPVTGDVHLLVGEGGQLKPFPEEQLEDRDSDPLSDQADDGTTPMLSAESNWITIKARSGEVVTSSWTDPTDQDTNLIPAPLGSPDDDAQRLLRVQKVLGLTRSGAVESREEGS